MGEVKTHKDLDIWKIGIELVLKIYELTNKFPDSEKFGLTSQMRRCVISIPANISEGAARNSKKEFIQFLYISLSSLSELETHLIIAEKLNYTDIKEEIDFIETLRPKILNFIKYQKTKLEKG